MAKLLLDGRTARALSALGGRNLLKTSELLAGNLAEMVPGSSVKSDGSRVELSLGKHSIGITPEEGKPVFRGNYYVYQKGSLAFEGEKRALEEVKKLLLKIASPRKHYLLARYDTDKLDEYGIGTDFVAEIEKNVALLEVKL